ncbi:hypothetical protein VVD49_01830 [Uliginosibacterium sp. H3]|uniref:SbsA Ig-like domain-containing protein n=1 Tax=Uliginosibacterium silvisoli TaxID=3114758 RepID=A0ABU6JYT8_9RHOO|nr:hypothetical protein [Uliginosibacterium sp. H3]
MSVLRSWVAACGLMLCAVAPVGAASRATAIVYPSGPTVPENLLRIELRFSAPLLAPLSIEHVKLFDAEGRAIEDAFLDLPLPSADRRSVTLLLHPGRVKSGVGANVLFGRALVAGSAVTLVVDDPALTTPVRKTWQVSAFDAAAPVPTRWTLDAPAAGSRQTLSVRLDATISSTAESLIAVRGPDGKRAKGRISLADAETMWRFTPDRVWSAGAYAVVVHPDLEDPAGNRSCAAFELRDESRTRCNESIEKPFQISKRKEITRLR